MTRDRSGIQRALSAIVTVAALAAAPSDTHAQFTAGARSTAMGGAGMVFATGVDAAELNPANLAGSRAWEVSLIELGGATLSTGATFAEILAIFGADFLGSTDVNVPQLIQRLPADGIGLTIGGEGYSTALLLDAFDAPTPGSPLPTIGVAFGPFALRVRSQAVIDASMSREMADLVGNGFQEERIQEYRVGDTGFRSASYSEITGSYGARVGDRLTVGFGARYVKGHSLADGRFFEPVLDLTSSPQTLSVSAVAVESAGGSGFGLDFGLSLELPYGFRASVSGTNVVQHMTWDEALVAHTATFTDTDFDENDFVDLLDVFDSQPVDPSSVSLPVYQTAQGLFMQSYFPATFRGGVGYRTGGTTVELVGISVAPRGRHRTAWDQRISLGLEQRIPVVTLRAGLASAQDGIRVVTGGLGFRLGPVHLDASGGYFGGDDAGAHVYDGYHATFSLSVAGGGS